MADPIALHGGADLRAQALLDAVLEVIRERGQGMAFPTVLGVLRLAEMALVEAQKAGRG